MRGGVVCLFVCVNQIYPCFSGGVGVQICAHFQIYLLLSHFYAVAILRLSRLSDNNLGTQHTQLSAGKKQTLYINSRMMGVAVELIEDYASTPVFDIAEQRARVASFC